MQGSLCALHARDGSVVSRIPLDGRPVKIGAHVDATGRVDKSKAVVVLERRGDGGWWLCDFDPVAAAVALNGQPRRRAFALAHGDVLQVGRRRFRAELRATASGEVATATAAASTPAATQLAASAAAQAKLAEFVQRFHKMRAANKELGRALQLQQTHAQQLLFHNRRLRAKCLRLMEPRAHAAGAEQDAQLRQLLECENERLHRELFEARRKCGEAAAAAAAAASEQHRMRSSCASVASSVWFDDAAGAASVQGLIVPPFDATRPALLQRSLSSLASLAERAALLVGALAASLRSSLAALSAEDAALWSGVQREAPRRVEALAAWLRAAAAAMDYGDASKGAASAARGELTIGSLLQLAQAAVEGAQSVALLVVQCEIASACGGQVSGAAAALTSALRSAAESLAEAPAAAVAATRVDFFAHHALLAALSRAAGRAAPVADALAALSESRGCDGARRSALNSLVETLREAEAALASLGSQPEPEQLPSAVEAPLLTLDDLQSQPASPRRDAESAVGESVSQVEQGPLHEQGRPDAQRLDAAAQAGAVERLASRCRSYLARARAVASDDAAIERVPFTTAVRNARELASAKRDMGALTAELERIFDEVSAVDRLVRAARRAPKPSQSKSPALRATPPKPCVVVAPPPRPKRVSLSPGGATLVFVSPLAPRHATAATKCSPAKRATPTRPSQPRRALSEVPSNLL
jgi:hypothetical protein